MFWRNSLNLNGGSVWESNPSCPFVTGNTGFEVQEGHQNPMHSRGIQYSIVKAYNGVNRQSYDED